jgi:hypothetical protein
MLSELKTKVLILNERLWERRNAWPKVQAWLDNFVGAVATIEEEQLHALYLLTHFLYFGSREVRELLHALYRDQILYPILQDARLQLNGTSDEAALTARLTDEIKKMRVFGVGNPSESGCHLLYFFRQENMLPREIFWETHRITVKRNNPVTGAQETRLRDATISRYVFIDDFCGSGQQAVEYSKDLVDEIKSQNPAAEVWYFPVFALATGIEHVRTNSGFTKVCGVCELDDGYRTFSGVSRCLSDVPAGLNKPLFRALAEHYGNILKPGVALGWDDGQLLVGFHHNTPDNTLPIISYSEPGGPAWNPIFRRYPKVALTVSP